MHQPPISILLIEDDAFMTSIVQFMLERQQMRVTCVADGQKALQLLAETPSFDAVLLDWLMPQVSGLEVLAKFKQHPEWSAIPVVMLSAVDDGQEIARAFKAGASDYLTKPFDPQEMLARLTRFIPQFHVGA
jgi:DNA-binding response OmpR family regulator